MPLCRHPLILQSSKYLFFEPLTTALKRRFNLTKGLQSNHRITPLSPQLPHRHFLQLAFLPARSTPTQVARPRASSSAIKAPTLIGKQALWLGLPSLLCASLPGVHQCCGRDGRGSTRRCLPAPAGFTPTAGFSFSFSSHREVD